MILGLVLQRLCKGLECGSDWDSYSYKSSEKLKKIHSGQKDSRLNQSQNVLVSMMSKIYTAVPTLVSDYQAPLILCPSSNCLQADSNIDIGVWAILPRWNATITRYQTVTCKCETFSCIQCNFFSW